MLDLNVFLSSSYTSPQLASPTVKTLVLSSVNFPCTSVRPMLVNVFLYTFVVRSNGVSFVSSTFTFVLVSSCTVLGQSRTLNRQL